MSLLLQTPIKTSFAQPLHTCMHILHTQTLCQHFLTLLFLLLLCESIGSEKIFFFFWCSRGVGRERVGPEWRQQRGRICPLRSVWMYTSGPGEAALGASRLLNTPILGAAGAGQVISIIRGEGSHTYGNAGVWGALGGGLERRECVVVGEQGLAAGVSHLCQRSWCPGVSWEDAKLHRQCSFTSCVLWFVHLLLSSWC